MKKLLSFLGSITLIASSSTAVISCGIPNKNYYENPDHNGGSDSDQSPLTKQLILDAFQTRVKGAILTDVYSINATQTKSAAFAALSDDKKNLSVTYDTYFDDKTLINSASDNIDTIGSLGYQGGIVDVILDGIGLNDTMQTIIGAIIGSDLHSQEFKDEVNKILSLVRQVLGSSLPNLATQIPALEKQIPDDMFDKIPGIFKNIIGDTVQDAINTFANHDNVSLAIKGLIAGSDLSNLADLSISAVFDGFFADLTNFIGSGLDAEFKPFSETEVDFDALAKYWFDNKTNLANFNFSTNTEQTITYLMKFLGIFNNLLTIYKTVEVSYVDDKHIFSDTVSNDEFVNDLQNKVFKDYISDLKNFAMGNFVSNLIYYFNPTNHNQQNFQKFMYAWLYAGNDETIPSFWKFCFAMIKADENSANPTVQTGISDKLEPMYHETLAPKFLQPILNNQPVLEADNDYEIKGLKDFFDIITSALGEKPMGVIYQDNLNPIIDGLETLIGVDALAIIKEKLKALIGDGDLNALSLMNISLNKILGLSNVEGFPTNEKGLIPNYAGYYTSRSLRQLVNELKVTFNFNGAEKPESLKNYFLNFNTVDKVVGLLLYNDQKPVEGEDPKGVLANLIDDLVNKRTILPNLGYVEKNNSEAYKDSFLGQTMLMFIPELETLDQPTFNFKSDVLNKQDNFGWIIGGFLSVMNKAMLPTDYSDFVHKVMLIDQAFDIKLIKSEDFKNSGNIRLREYKITYNLDKVHQNLSSQDNTVYTYQLAFQKATEFGKYEITVFKKQ